MLAIEIRPATARDTNFILASAKRAEAGACAAPDWLGLNARWVGICDRNPVALVACCPDDENVILGHIVFSLAPDGLIVWSTYVKHAYRRERIASRLLREALQLSTGDKLVFVSAALPGVLDKAAELGFQRIAPAHALAMLRRAA